MKHFIRRYTSNTLSRQGITQGVANISSQERQDRTSSIDDTCLTSTTDSPADHLAHAQTNNGAICLHTSHLASSDHSQDKVELHVDSSGEHAELLDVSQICSEIGINWSHTTWTVPEQTSLW